MSDRDEFYESMQTALQDVLKNKKSTIAQKMAAVTAGTKLLMVKNKLKDPDDENKSFFGAKK